MRRHISKEKKSNEKWRRERKFHSLNDLSDSPVFDLWQIFFSAYFILLFIRLAARIL